MIYQSTQLNVEVTDKNKIHVLSVLVPSFRE